MSTLVSHSNIDGQPGGLENLAAAPLRLQQIAFSRHDQHNLELKTSLAFSAHAHRTTVDLYFFMPRNLHVSEWTKHELHSDFHSRLRMAIQQNVSRHETTVRTLHRKLAGLLELYHGHSETLPTGDVLDEIFSETRQLGAVLGEILKFESQRLRKEILLVLSLSNMAPRPDHILADVLSALHRVDLIFLETVTLAQGELNAQIPVMRLLRQYAHQLYTDFVGGLDQEMQMVASDAARLERPDLSEAWKKLATRLTELQNREARAFAEFDSHGSTETEDQIQELRLLRISQIKKFFQSQMFIEVARKETIRRFSEPAAAGAAAFAAGWAATFEYLSKPSLTTFGFKGLVVICMGVALYVLKDRLKDQFRAVFTRKLADYLPEAEQSLTAEGRQVGRVREWFSLRKMSEIPKEIFGLRRRGDLTEAERHLPEDVIHYAQEFGLESKENNYGQFDRSIQQILRINVDRYLKHLDDAYKTVRVLNGDGQLLQIRSHRVYHFHVCVGVRDGQPGRKWFNFARSRRASDVAPLREGYSYRVVVDKHGVERVEAV